MNPLDESLKAAISSRVTVRDDGCWEWKNSMNRGLLYVEVSGKDKSALRISWVAFKGELDPKRMVMRTCGNPRCVAPEHLTLKELHPGFCVNGHVRPANERGKCRKCVKEANEQRKKRLSELVTTDAVGRQVTRWFALNRSNQLKKYGITEDALVRMLEQQGWKCAICSSVLLAEGDRTKFPHVDHCHATGRVRGILCLHCNSALGYLKDSPQRARLAALYLEGATMPQACTPGEGGCRAGSHVPRG